jgi:hypothetical protein
MREKCSFSTVQEPGFDALNAPKRIAEEVWEGISVREPEHRSALRMGEVSRDGGRAVAATAATWLAEDSAALTTA